LADENLKYTAKHKNALHKRFKKATALAETLTGIATPSLILPIPVTDAAAALEKRAQLQEAGFDVGAIRPPTVTDPILRVILRTHDLKKLKKALTAVAKHAL
jgi:8-amino-7-oxononanoate synthase